MDGTSDDAYFSEEIATFGDRVAAAREVVGLSQAQLARRLGVKLATIEAWESDRSEPRANRLQMLAGLLNVSIMWLMTGEGEGLAEFSSEEADTSADVLKDTLAEVRAVRAEQRRLAERLARLEKRLRMQIG
ncbi:MAG: helix-turn-helix domain-containing protein [Pseudomonadota bacterium]